VVLFRGRPDQNRLANVGLPRLPRHADRLHLRYLH
jgi:hypothetical protein